MKKGIFYAILLFFVALVSFEIYAMSGGGLNFNGAPEENNCTGCHTGVANSDSKGSISINVEGNPTQYITGQTYNVSVTVNYPGRNRFGFAFDVRKKGVAFLPMGSLSAAENSGVGARGYVTHESNSIDASNTKTWTFKWTAPQTKDTVVFYASGIAANNDKDNIGDQTYTTSKTLLPNLSNSIKESSMIVWKDIFPNPVSDKIALQFNVNRKSNYQIELLDNKGVVKEMLFNAEMEVGEQQLDLSLKGIYAPGVYFVRVLTGNALLIKKIAIF